MDDHAEVDAKLSETHAVVERKLMEQKLEFREATAELRNEMARLRVELSEFRAEMREAYSRLETKMAQMETRLVRWFAASVIAVITAFVAISAVLVNTVHEAVASVRSQVVAPAPAPAPQQPLVIVVPLER
jgi:predicted nuclease with TOPRIM domain